ncbi:MAG: hypothetical protein P0Y64_16785 [Candidatus Sphingomonas colombiensis]|nr:hypothetical protein [Sphingomonas sp.]WEK42976.1 MAG: hypothetical protein P0Y64_16785 [Sphingomonas sp.]
MKSFTNHTAGPRGINLLAGGTRWLEPGETVELDPEAIAGAVPDLGHAPSTKEDRALKAENHKALADLKKQVDDLTKDRDALKAENEKLKAKA